MSNVEVSKYSSLIKETGELNNPSFNNKTVEEFSLEKLSKITRKHLARIVGLEKSLKELNLNFNEQLKKISNLEVKISQQTGKFSLINDLFIVFITIFAVTFLTWFYDSWRRIPDLQNNLTSQTERLNKEIEFFQKEIEDLRDNNQKLKENIKNEIEKEIYKTILQKN